MSCSGSSGAANWGSIWCVPNSLLFYRALELAVAHAPVRYQELLVRGASEHETIDREIHLDTTPFPIPDAMVRMKGTGGWCRAQDDWAWNTIANPDGTPATISLKKGTHTLRWNYIQGSQNLDLFVLRPVPHP